jgi:hypothetical protein
MSFIGKLLVVAQAALSILFMAAAGAVYSAHTYWKGEAEKAKAQLATQTTQQQTALTNAEQEKTTLNSSLNDEKQLRLNAETELAQLQTKAAADSKRIDELQAQIQTQTGIAETKSNEASYRNEEATKQRVITGDLQRRLDAATEELRQLTDVQFTLKSDMGELQARHDALLADKAFLEKVVAKAGLSTDPRSVAALTEPPPPVDGVVKEVRKDRTNRPRLLVLSLGNDDGLLKGHELDAYRSGVDGRPPQWLGKIRILSTGPDDSVAEIIDSAKNGIIEVGDNVTTKLL